MKAAAASRRASRLAAVQALYEIDRSAASVDEVITAVCDQGAVLDESGLSSPADTRLLAAVARSAMDNREILDGMIDDALASNWTTARLETLMRAVLRAGAGELLVSGEVPARVVISDYVDVAHAFWERGEPGMVNAVLDRLARRLRAAEFDT